MGEENAGFEDGPICGALIEFRRGGGIRRGGGRDSHAGSG